MAFGAKISVGARNIKVNALGASATLSRDLQAAMQEFSGSLNEFTDQLEGFLPDDLTRALGPTLELSRKYCPVDTGELVGSSYLATEGFRGGARAEIGYAKGGNPNYAIFVHEIPATHAAPTSDKFLQRAIDEDYFNILERVAVNVAAHAGSSVSGDAGHEPAPVASGGSSSKQEPKQASKGKSGLKLRKFSFE